ncbi:MAG: AAA family ATPase, partial [Acidobacteria bacterium]|nr:AAA family ATPase [Acidobacteriota bacterium]
MPEAAGGSSSTSRAASTRNPSRRGSTPAFWRAPTRPPRRSPSPTSATAAGSVPKTTRTTPSRTRGSSRSGRDWRGAISRFPRKTAASTSTSWSAGTWRIRAAGTRTTRASGRRAHREGRNPVAGALSPPPDAAAREAAADPGRNVVLRASAGTGKTTVLTSRYVRLVEAGVPPRNILALTFTRKAAQEMKDRILRELSEPRRRGVLGNRSDVADVNISTLDAFTLGLIREFPLDAGVSPGVEVLDERSMPVFRAEAIERVFSGITGFDREVLASLPPLLGRSASRVQEAADNYLERRLAWRRLFEAKAAEHEGRRPPPRPCLQAFLRPVAESCRRLWEAARDGSAGFETPFAVRLALRARDQGGARDALDREALEDFFRTDLKNPPKDVPEVLKPDYAAVTAKVREFRSAWLDYLNEHAFGPVWKLFQAVEREYDRLKRERRVMDFDDLTLAATRLLQGLGEFSASRFRLEARYHHLLLDEFHDTSDPQWELLKAIVAPWTAGEGLASEEVRRVTNGRLSRPTIFVVADHKQSIYRFRDARVEILGRAEDAIQALAQPGDPPSPRLVLRWNFRSNLRLRRFVNSAGAEIAAASRADPDSDWAFRYDEDDHFPAGESPDGEPLALAVAVAGDHEEAAARIAARVEALLGGGEARPEHIALMARNNRHLAVYLEALKRRGIPTFLFKGAGFFDTSEVRDLRALCRFLARPHSDRRAVELLRSRFFALPGDDFARLRRAGDSGTPFADLLLAEGNGLPEDLPAGTRRRLEGAGSVAGRWIRLSRRLPPSRTVAAIVEETGYLRRAAAAADAPHESDQERANVAKTLQLLRGLERPGFASFERVAEGLESAANGDATQGAVEAAGAVQVLSIHAAKGLEFEHVFLVDCGGSGRPETKIPRVVETAGGAWSIALVTRGSAWRVTDGGRADSEERRCMYVAMTRAKASLTLSWKMRTTRAGKPHGSDLPRYLPTGLATLASRTIAGEAESFSWAGHQIEVLPAAADPEGRRAVPQ